MSSPPDILLVEDNLQDAELTIRALKQRNLANNIVHAIDGEAALDFLFGTGIYEGRNLLEQPKVV